MLSLLISHSFGATSEESFDQVLEFCARRKFTKLLQKIKVRNWKKDLKTLPKKKSLQEHYVKMHPRSESLF